ncbi:MAG: uracil-DNA glycosylase [Desulfobacteraceae bacterium]|nr:uracil-DNA glycosylase [Desulfobacteraceae bacterium]
MSDQEIIRLLQQTRDLLAFHQGLGLDGLPRSAAVEAFLRGPDSGAGKKMAAGPGSRKQRPSPLRREPEAAAPVTSLAALREEVEGCRQCACGEKPARIHGAGGVDSGLLVVVDPPGDGSAPVAGPAAELLAKMLAAISLHPETVHVTSLLKCPLDREPAPGELESCLALLRREIAAAAPRVICSMGPLAAATLLRSKQPLFALRGRLRSFHDLPLLPTFHPAFLLKNPEMKKAAWLDLQAIQKQLRR